MTEIHIKPMDIKTHTAYPQIMPVEGEDEKGKYFEFTVNLFQPQVQDSKRDRKTPGIPVVSVEEKIARTYYTEAVIIDGVHQRGEQQNLLYRLVDSTKNIKQLKKEARQKCLDASIGFINSVSDKYLRESPMKTKQDIINSYSF